jgi:phenylpropionate dioxygenase-like ring-hydroxylating dioxygenase large terminal subunit
VANEAVMTSRRANDPDRTSDAGAALSSMLVHPDGFLPKGRYVSPEFAALEAERLWPRVWQIAAREEQLRRPGDFVEYTIVDESILVVRTADDRIAGFHNACLHRGRRLAHGCGTFEGEPGPARCPYHAWRYALDGRLVEVVDPDEFDPMPEGLALAPVRVECWGGFVWVNMDAAAEPLATFLEPLAGVLAPYRLDQLRLRAHLTTRIGANWKAVVDAFNEGYHVQGLHAQILPWTDDVSIEYEQLGVHSHYGRLPGARRRLHPSPRLGLGDDYDEGDILAGMVGNLGGAFLREERAIVEELRAEHLPLGELLGAFQDRRMELLQARGFDTTGLTPDQMTSAEDAHFFPNVVGPIYPGSAIVFRVRPDGRDPDRAIKDTWVLEWPRADREWKPPEQQVVDDWRDRDWGEITEQDYSNLEAVQAGMKSRGFTGARLNRRQEANVLHMHRMVDAYLIGDCPATAPRPR